MIQLAKIKDTVAAQNESINNETLIVVVIGVTLIACSVGAYYI